MRLAFVGAAAVAALLALGTGAGADETKWLTSYEEALKKAKAEKKAILIDFTGSDWCGWCIRLQDEVFKKKEFQEWAAKRVVLLELDFPKKKKQPAELKKQNAELAEKFGVEGFPTIVFLDEEGNEKGRSGYLEGGPVAWTKNADEVLDGAKEEPKKEEKKPEKAPEVKKVEGPVPEVTWHASWDKAAELAKKEEKLILAEFTGSDWCLSSEKLKKEILESDAFKRWAAPNVVLLELDFPRKKAQPDEVRAANKKLKEKYGVKSFPTVLVLDAEGKKVGEFVHEDGPEAWTRKAQEILDKTKKK